MFLTVAGPGGATVEPGTELYQHLIEALAKAGDPFIRIRVKSYREALFKVTGGFKMDPDRVRDKVKAAVDARAY